VTPGGLSACLEVCSSWDVLLMAGVVEDHPETRQRSGGQLASLGGVRSTCLLRKIAAPQKTRAHTQIGGLYPGTSYPPAMVSGMATFSLSSTEGTVP
jgi:hypothetical protein